MRAVTAPCACPEQVDRFLAAQGLSGAGRQPLAGDASSRRYQRLFRTGGAPLILMQAPDPARELLPFVTVAGLVRPLGLSVPEIYAVDAEAGLMLLEDFGDATFSASLDRGAGPAPLYGLAVDALVTLHRAFAVGPEAAALPVFDGPRFLDQAGLFAQRVPVAVTGRPLEAKAHFAYETAWRAVLPHALSRPTLLLRDFHAGNLMALPQRPGVRACGLLDIQDAGIGPAAYDLVSLIEDARRDLEPALAAALVDRYLRAFPELEPAAFHRGWSVLAALRHTRVIAVFLRLAGQGKRGYLAHLPRLWRYLAGHLEQPELAPLAGWFDRHLPLDLCFHRDFVNEAT
jgi:aminoglycoside/choline kinase family phosphotransferase